MMLAVINSSGLAQIEYAGFADILYNSDLEAGGNAGFGYGQFELDLSGTVVSNVSFEGAISYNAEDGVFEAGAGFLDIQWLDMGLIVGQFDVPFGIDYLYIPSPDRLLVSGTLMNQRSIDGWNDVGMNLYGELVFVNFNLFAVNGASKGIAVGGRLGVPTGNLTELGVSYAMQTKENEAGAVPSIMGLDFQSTIGLLNARFEYQLARAVMEGNFDTHYEDIEHSGYYAQFDLNLDDMLNIPIFVVGRYGDWEQAENTENRITAGLGY